MTRRPARGDAAGYTDREAVSAEMPIPGVPGVGRWLVLIYEPTSLFSLKMSTATSSVGRTLVVPTPFSVKMSIVDAAFLAGWEAPAVVQLVEELARVDVRIGVPERATVTHTIIKVRQEPKDKKKGPPYIPAVAYREFVHYRGQLRWAFDVTLLRQKTAEALVRLAPIVHSIGKRGGFIQYLAALRMEELSVEFTQPLDAGELRISAGIHVAVLDDFGPEANLDALNIYTQTPIRRDRHRKFVETLVPLGIVNVGPGFTEYWSAVELNQG